MMRLLSITLCVLTLVACNRNTSPEPVDPTEEGAVSVEGPASLSATSETASFELENAGEDVLDFSIRIRNDADNPSQENWFSLSQEEGRLEPGGSTVLVLTLINTLPAGNYSAILDVTYQGGVTSFEVLGEIGNAGSAGTAQIIGTLTTDNQLISVTPARLESVPNKLLAQNEEQPSFVPGQLLVEYAPVGLSTQSLDSQAVGEQARVQQDLRANYGLRVMERNAAGQADLVNIGTQDVLKLAAELNADPRVSYAEPVYYLYTTGVPNDELLADQWPLALAGLPVAWSAETGADADVVVAVIDSGFATNHPDLRGRFLPGIDFCAQLTGQCSTTTDTDPGNGNPANSHGSHVAGILGASANNNQGIAGVAYGSGIKLLPIKIFNDDGEGATSVTFINGIRWAAGLDVKIGDKVLKNPNPADIINMSLGGFFDSRAVQGAINEARAAGSMLIAASGNNGVDQIMSPAAAEGVIAVGSVTPSFRRSCFANYGEGAFGAPGKLDLVTAGGEGLPLPLRVALEGVTRPTCRPAAIQIVSTVPGGRYEVQAGTSMAAPLAAGVAALILAQQPGLSVEQLETKLLESTYFDDSYMNESEYGAGILRAESALGLPGPGAEVTVSANGSSSALDTVILDLLGSSTSYTLDGLTAGQYQVEAKTGGSGAVLTANADVSLNANDAKRLDLALSAE